MPMKRRPSSCAATPVDPTPMNGSRTRSPGRDPHSISWRRTRSGFWVGWTGSFTRSPRGRVEGELIPGGDVVVERLPPAHLDVPGRVGAQVVRRIRADEIDALVGDPAEQLAAVTLPEGRRGGGGSLGRLGRIDHRR